MLEKSVGLYIRPVKLGLGAITDGGFDIIVYIDK
jgi:hypothetical protein